MTTSKLNFKSMYVQLGLVVSGFVIFIELVLLLFSLNSKERELVQIRNQFEHYYSVEKTNTSHQVIEPLSPEDISKRLKKFTVNIILLTLIIIGTVVVGTLYIFHHIIGKHINYVIRLNKQTQSHETIEFRDNRKVRCLEIDEILASRDLMLERIEESNYRITSLSNLSALGEMAGNVAHEINNPLAIITSTLSLMKILEKKGTLTSEVLNEKLGIISETTLRISKIVTGLRVLARDSSKDLSVDCSAYSIVESVLNISKERMSVNNVELIIPSKEVIGPLMVHCKEIQVSQVLVNLFNNAFDAISEQKDGKWIRLDVEKRNLFLEFIVTDSGTGIPDEVLEKIFQPYYTTKDIGKGTGLGLSLSSKMIEQSGGKLWYDKSSQNTCFKFTLLLAS